MAVNQHSSNKATRSQVQLGDMEIEGYLLPEHLWTETNKFGVSKTQAVLLAYPDYDRNIAASRYMQIVKSKKAKTLALTAFVVHSKISYVEGNEKVDLLPLDQLPSFLKICAKLGSTHATDLLIDLAGLSLQQIFSDAFSLKFEKEDRQKWLKMRAKTKEDFWFLADAIQAYHEKYPRNERFRGENYSRVFDTLNIGLFGKPARTIKKELGISSGLNRDHFGKESLTRIDMIQRLAQAHIEHHGCEPKQAVLKALRLMQYKHIGYLE